MNLSDILDTMLLDQKKHELIFTAACAIISQLASQSEEGFIEFDLDALTEKGSGGEYPYGMRTEVDLEKKRIRFFPIQTEEEAKNLESLLSSGTPEDPNAAH